CFASLTKPGLGLCREPRHFPLVRLTSRLAFGLASLALRRLASLALLALGLAALLFLRFPLLAITPRASLAFGLARPLASLGLRPLGQRRGGKWLTVISEPQREHHLDRGFPPGSVPRTQAVQVHQALFLPQESLRVGGDFPQAHSSPKTKGPQRIEEPPDRADL